MIQRRRMPPPALVLLALAAALTGCGSSVTGFRSRAPLAEFDLVGVDSAARPVPDADRLVVLATGQYTAVDAEFDLFVAAVLPGAARGADRPIGPEDGVRLIVIRNSPDVQAFVVQHFDVTEGAVRWEGGRPVVHLRAESESHLPASLRQVPAWHALETTLRCDTAPHAFSRMADRFCTECLLGRQPRGPLEQMIRLLRGLDEAAAGLKSALDEL